jgi:protein TonB
MRIAVSSIAALFVTLALFYVMQSMIIRGGQPIEKPVIYGVVDFVRLQRGPAEGKTESLQRMPARQPAAPPRALPALSPNLTPTPPPAAPHPELTTELLPSLKLAKPYLNPATADMAKAATETQPSAPSSLPTSSNTTGFGAPTLTTGAAPALQGGRGNDEAEAIPIFKIEPKYPRKAARSKIEGWVKLEFTITESGTVSDPVVVDSNPRRTFDRSAIQSIRKWRFKPKVVDGRPVQRKASQVIEFRLTRNAG